LLAKIKISEPKRSRNSSTALTKASKRELTMAKHIVAKKMSTIALAGGRAFFVSACWPKPTLASRRGDYQHLNGSNHSQWEYQRWLTAMLSE